MSIPVPSTATRVHREGRRCRARTRSRRGRRLRAVTLVRLGPPRPSARSPAVDGLEDRFGLLARARLATAQNPPVSRGDESDALKDHAPRAGIEGVAPGCPTVE